MGPSRIGRRLVAAVGALGLALPAMVQVQFFPYSYTYVNELVVAVDLPSSDDFWQASARELAADAPPGRFVVCGVARDLEGHPLRRMPGGGQSWLDLSNDCAIAPAGVMAPYRQEMAASPLVDDRFMAMLVSEPGVAPGCREVATVTRPLLWSRTTMSALWDCPVLLPDYVDHIDFDGAGTGSGYLLGGWAANGGAPEITTAEAGSLGFRVPTTDGGVRLRLSGHSPREPRFRVNNQPVVAMSTADGWVLQVDELAPWGRDGDVVLTVVAAGSPVHISRISVASDGDQ